MLIAIIVICILGIVSMLVCLAKFPSLKIGKIHLQTFWMGPMLAAIILLVFGLVKWDYFTSFLLAPSSINPLEILVLFLSMAFISIVLDEAGFFSYLASKAIKMAGQSQLKVFMFLYLLTSVLTIFTSNDVIILTFTPFLIYFSKRSKVDPIPYLVGEFVAANSWSMLLLVGNPTNIYLAESFGIDFLTYFLNMWPSALAAGVVGFAIMMLLFHKKLQVPFSEDEEKTEPIKSKVLMWASLSCLFACIILMAFANFLSWPLWLISLVAAVSLLLFFLVYLLFNKKHVYMFVDATKRLPYEVIPFVISMFVLVLGLKSSGVTSSIAGFLNSFDVTFSYGISAFLSSNLVNNIPMSVLFSEIIKEADVSSKAIYASIISSNLGAILSPVGALAGIMWMNLLKEHEVKYPFGKFLGYGSLISIPSLGASLLLLSLL